MQLQKDIIHYTSKRDKLNHSGSGYPENKMSVKIGQIVTYHPGNVKEKQLPNGMESAPAIVTQLFFNAGDVQRANLTVFTANPDGEPQRQEWSVMNGNHPLIQGNEGCPSFTY